MSQLLNPSLRDVFSEFGTTTRNNLALDSLRTMYSKVFGSATTGDRLSDHDGTGKPEGTNEAMDQDCAGGDFRPIFNGNIDFYGGPTGTADCHYRWKYDTDPLFPSPSYTSTQTTPTNGSVDFTPSSFDFSAGQTVYCVLQVWNEYNDAAESDYVESSQVSITFSTDTLAQPSLTAAGDETRVDNDVAIYVEFDYPAPDGDDATGWDVQTRLNGGSATNANVDCTDYNSGDQRQGIRASMAELAGPSDTVEVRVRAKATDGCNDTSAWSDWATSSDGSVPSCPISV